jgi:hypothetical protein
MLLESASKLFPALINDQCMQSVRRRNGSRSLAAAMFREFATRGRVSGRDILKVVPNQNLVDILSLVYFHVSGLLLHVHTQIPWHSSLQRPLESLGPFGQIEPVGSSGLICWLERVGPVRIGPVGLVDPLAEQLVCYLGR